MLIIWVEPYGLNNNIYFIYIKYTKIIISRFELLLSKLTLKEDQEGTEE